MKARVGLFATLILGAASALGADPLSQAQALCQERTDDKGRISVLYKFDADADLHIWPVEQAGRRGKEAAEAWQLFGKSDQPVAVIARSPYGGGETAKSYWPAGVKPELLRCLVEPLNKAGLKKVVLPDLPVEAGEGAVDATAEPAKPWPQAGFSEDYEFALLVGLHHEPIPYVGGRRQADGKPIYSRGSRVNAWAILFHCRTGTAFWATTAMVRVGYRGVADPLNLAAETVLGYLDFSRIGTDNIPTHIQKLRQAPGLNTMDLAAMLVQTQRADAVSAVMKLAADLSVYRTKPHVLRYFNERGTAQDYRIDPEQAKGRKFVYASQPVTLRVLLIEQLRGMRGVQGCSLAALVQVEEDFEIGPLGQSLAGRVQPLNGDDEIVLIGELAHSDRRRIFRRYLTAAVRNLGKCRVHIDDAMAVAKFYADRKVPPPPRGRRPGRDPLKEAGQAALLELNRARSEQQKKKAAAEAD